MEFQTTSVTERRLEDIGAQTLLEHNVRHSGFLERKVRLVSTVSRWARCYTILYQGSLYVYSGPTSRKPDITCSLLAYERVEVQKDRTHEPLWVFFMVPLVSSMPTLIFAAPSKRELGQWLAELRLAMLTVHKRPTASVEVITQRMKTDSNWSLDSDQYGQLTQSVNHQEQQLPNVNRRSLTIHPVPTAPLYTGFQEVPIDTRLQQPVDANDSESYYRSAIFEGNREQAVEELLHYGDDGVYMVRRSEGREVLTVKFSSNIVKYCLEQRPMDGAIQIQGGSNLPSFPSLAHLLHHYHHNDLPNRNFKLVIPFRLAERT